MTPQIFLSELMTGYPVDRRDLRLEIRPLRPKWYEGENDFWRFRQWFPLSGSLGAVKCATALMQRFDVYMGVLPRNGRHGGKYDVIGASWLWCDVDGGSEGAEGSARLVHLSDVPRPHMAVKSGNGLHCYWRLQEMVELSSPADCDAFKDTLKRLVLTIGGKAPNAHADSTRADTASILRVPDTLNHKDKLRSKPVRFISYHPTDKAFPYQWWMSLLPELPKSAPTYTSAPRYKPVTPGEIRELPESVMRAFRAPTPAGMHNQTLTNALYVAAKYGYSASHIEMLGDTYAAVNPGVNVNSWLKPLVRSTIRNVRAGI